MAPSARIRPRRASVAGNGSASSPRPDSMKQGHPGNQAVLRVSITEPVLRSRPLRTIRCVRECSRQPGFTSP